MVNLLDKQSKRDIKSIISTQIGVHKAWSHSLKTLIEVKQPGGLIEEKVANPNLCSLGQWLLQSDTREVIVDKGVYDDICKLHREFHIIAGSIINKVLSGNADQAKVMLSEGGAYNIASEKLVMALSGIGNLL